MQLIRRASLEQMTTHWETEAGQIHALLNPDSQSSQLDIGKKSEETQVIQPREDGQKPLSR